MCAVETALTLETVSVITLVLYMVYGLGIGINVPLLIIINIITMVSIYVIEKYCTLGDEKESFSFPMKMYDITCDFVSRYPIYDELETCRRFLLSYENFWDP